MIQFLPLLISMLAAGGGAYAANRQNRAQVEEMNRREQAERERQRSIQAEADERLASTLNRFTPQEMQKDLVVAQQARAGDVAPLAAASAPDYTNAPASAPKEVGADLGRRLAEAREGGVDQSKRRAALAAFGDASLGQQFALTRGGQDIDRLSRNSRASARLLPGEFQQAQKKGGNWAIASDVANLISRAASNYGATQGAFGAKPPVVKPPTDPF